MPHSHRWSSEEAATALPSLESLSSLVDGLVQSGPGVIMAMGKGGVGKTTIAAAIATELAGRGLPVHLSTTDPAAHVAATAGATSGLEVSRIDPQAETQAYIDQVMATAGKNLDASARAMLEEDLRSPCTEEIAVFRAFARDRRPGPEPFCRPRHGANRTHALAARRHGSLPPRSRPQGQRHAGGSPQPFAPAPRPRLHPRPHCNSARGNACP